MTTLTYTETDIKKLKKDTENFISVSSVHRDDLIEVNGWVETFLVDIYVQEKSLSIQDKVTMFTLFFRTKLKSGKYTDIPVIFRIPFDYKTDDSKNEYLRGQILNELIHTEFYLFDNAPREAVVPYTTNMTELEHRFSERLFDRVFFQIAPPDNSKPPTGGIQYTVFSLINPYKICHENNINRLEVTDSIENGKSIKTYEIKNSMFIKDIDKDMNLSIKSLITEPKPSTSVYDIEEYIELLRSSGVINATLKSVFNKSAQDEKLINLVKELIDHLNKAELKDLILHLLEKSE